MKLHRQNKYWPGRLRRRAVHLCFIVAGALINSLPRRLAFLLLVACEFIGLRGRRGLAAAYQPYAVAFLASHPSWRFSARLSRLFPEASARVLFAIGAYRETSDLILEEGMAIGSSAMTRLLGEALFEIGEFEHAHTALSSRASGSDVQQDARLASIKSNLDIIAGDEAAALESMAAAARRMPHLMRPHQNIAARPSLQYQPNYLDLLSGASGKLFDLCNFVGQRVTHVGRGEVGVGLFARALAAQSELQKMPIPRLSPELTRVLDELDIGLDELRIIPEEWTTQIGHLGMLDILFRMQKLGWWSGKPLMAVRPRLVANTSFFRLFESAAKLRVIDDADPVADELLSLQRWCGLNFNAFRMPNGQVVPWQEAGALAIAQWEREDRPDPLCGEYDRVFASLPELDTMFQRTRKKWGMKADDWYVCLHIRDASHYFELAGTGQTHRNSPIEAYLDAIRFITGKGGWVIKLGGPNSPKLPAMARAVDYAQSDFKSDLMDIHLIRNARAFIGTTSGLTNVAVSFGIPSAIVNGITTDSQLWNKNVRFVLKPVRLADATMLTQRQLTSSPWRWRVFDAAVLGRSGGLPVNNTADEILEAVKEVEALASGRSAEFEKGYDAKALLSRWRDALALPHYYGTGRPSLHYLKKYEREFLRERTADSQGAATQHNDARRHVQSEFRGALGVS